MVPVHFGNHFELKLRFQINPGWSLGIPILTRTKKYTKKGLSFIFTNDKLFCFDDYNSCSKFDPSFWKSPTATAYSYPVDRNKWWKKRKNQIGQKHDHFPQPARKIPIFLRTLYLIIYEADFDAWGDHDKNLRNC